MDYSLLQALYKKSDEGKRLNRKLKEIREEAKQILALIVKTFPEYTPHDIGHKDRVMKNYEMLITNNLISEMNEYELFFLAAATYLHDIGLVNIPELKKYLPKKPKNNLELQTLIRNEHQIRSELFINKNYKDLKIENQSQAKIIGIISKGHRNADLRNHEIFDPETKYKEFTINVPLLTSLLRIADELDFTFERTPMIIYEHIPPKSEISHNEWKRQKNTDGVSPLNEYPQTIKADVGCENPKIHSALKHLETKINLELMNLQGNLFQYKKFGSEIPNRFEFKIKQIGYIAYDIKFTLEDEQIIKLLMGRQLYDNETDAIRELIKNSYDAIRIRENRKKEDWSLKPKLILTQSINKKEIIIEDNGIGMDQNYIKNYFMKIGSSLYSSEEFKEEKHDFAPVSELGIGVLSSFMIADKIKIETKMDDTDPIEVSIKDVSDYIIIKEGNMKETGTKITLTLKPKFVKELDLLKLVKKFAVHIPFQISVKHKDKTEEISNREFKSNIDNFKDYRVKIKKLDINLKDNDFEGIFSFMGKDVDGNWFPLKTTRQHNQKSNKNTNISYEGIHISSQNYFSWIERSNITYDINLKNKAVDLNAARNSIILNEKWDVVYSKINQKIIPELKKLIHKLASNDTKNDLYSNKFLDNYLSHSMDRWPSDFLKIFQDEIKYSVFNKNEIYKSTINDLKKQKKPIVVISEYTSYNNNLLLDIIKSCTKIKSNINYLMLDRFPYDDYLYILKLKKRAHINKMMENNLKNDLKNIISNKLFQPKNYKTNVFAFKIYDIHRGNDYSAINFDSKLTKLLIKGKKVITKDKALTIQQFVHNVSHKPNAKENLEILSLILDWFVDANIIKKSEKKNYTLKN